MEFNFASVLALVTAFLSGGVVALKVIAPRTKTDKDDKVLSVLEKVLSVLPKQEETKKAK
jgi:hypothetical protein